MRRTAFDEKSDQRAAAQAEPKDYHCPAHGCPNAASVSLDHGGRWACFAHAKAQPRDWPDVTQHIRQNRPASCNWNHPEKLAHEAEQAALRRAALKPTRLKAGGGVLSASEALALPEIA